MSTMKKGGHSEEQPPLRRTQTRRLAASIPLIYYIAQALKGQFNLKSGTVNNAVLITRRLIEEFRCADGWIDIVRYTCFERPLDRKGNSGDDIIRNDPMQLSHACRKKIAQKKRADASTLFRCRPKASTAIDYILVDIPCLSTGPAPKNVISIFSLHL